MKTNLALVTLLIVALSVLATAAQASSPEIIVDRATADIFPESWLTPRIDAKAELLSDDARDRCRKIVKKTLAKYPPAVLSANLKQVYVLGGLSYSGVRAAGTRSRSAVYVVSKPAYSAAQVEGLIHAEFSSILLQNFPSHLDKGAWQQINPPGFTYRGSGVQAIKDQQASLRSSEALHEEGFLNEYSKASIEEDFNSYATRLFMGDARLWDAIEKSPKVKAKGELTISFYGKLDASFTREFFLSLRPSEAGVQASDFAQATKLAPAFTPEDFLPPAPPWSGASEALIVPPDHPWITPTERSGMTDTPDYAETVLWLEKLAAASPRIRTITFGQTAQGRPLCAVIASREGIDELSKLPASGRPTVLVQGGIHSGEIDGKDAGMMLLRDIAFGGKAALLDKANLLFVPVLNADGHERRSLWNRPNQRGPSHAGWRTTAQNLNLNRDYMKAQAPEMIAVLKLIRESQPALYLDIHVTDGVDYEYDITYGFHGGEGGFAWSPKIGRWLDLTLRPALDAALANAGHIPGPLVFAKNPRDLSEGIIARPFDPRFSTGYGDLRHLPTLLIENHSLKPFRQRVLGTYVLIESCLRLAGEQSETLKQAIADDMASRPQTLGFNWNRAADHQTTIHFRGIASEDFDSPASGTREVRWQGRPQLHEKLPVHHVTKPGITVRRPRAYYIPVTEPDILSVLANHGVRIETLKEPQTLMLDRYRFVDPVATNKPFEGRHTLTTRVKAEPVTRTLPTGTVKVTTDQPLGDLAIALLEPEHLDSLAAWGFVPEILQRTEYIEGYVIAPLAEKMLADDSKLKAEFDAKLAADPAFAKNPDARLQWFYQRSPFYDQEYLRYPVLIER